MKQTKSIDRSVVVSVCAVVVLLHTIIQNAGAETATYQQSVDGYAGTLDTHLNSGNSDVPHDESDCVIIDCCDSNPDCSQGNVSCPDHGLLRFDGIFGCGPKQIPMGSSIESAILRITVPSDGQGAISTCLHRMLQESSEKDTWNGWDDGVQADDMEAAVTPDACLGSPINAGTVTIDVTTSVQAWAAGANNYGWVFLPGDEANDGWCFSSSEAEPTSIRPELEVTFTSPAPGSCPADLNCDGVVDATDLAILLGSWGPCVTNLVLNGEFTKNADGWTLIDHSDANWLDSPGWDGNPGWFKINHAPGNVPETWQLITGLIPDETYVVSGYFKKLHHNSDEPNFQVLLDEAVLFEAGGNVEDGWTFFSFDYVADNSEVLLLFRSQVTTDDDYGIDNIRFVRK